MSATASDVLSSEALLLTVVALLMTTWYGEIQDGLKIPVKPYYVDRAGDRARARAILWRRTVPMVVVAGATSAAFAPNSVTLAGHLRRNDSWVWPGYSVVSVSEVTVNLLMAAAALYAVALLVLVARKLSALNRGDSAQT
jgi:hypothetical protein